MSVPNTLHALPARERSAVSVDPELLTFVAVYPGQASRTVGSTQTAAATPRRPKRVRGFDKTPIEKTGWRGWVEVRSYMLEIFYTRPSPSGMHCQLFHVWFHQQIDGVS